MGKVYIDDPTDPANHPFLLLLIWIVILSLIFCYGCISVDSTGIRAGIIGKSYLDENGVEVHQRSCTGISILW